MLAKIFCKIQPSLRKNFTNKRKSVNFVDFKRRWHGKANSVQNKFELFKKFQKYRREMSSENWRFLFILREMLRK